MRELIPPRPELAVVAIGFLSTGELYKSYVYEYCSSYSAMDSSTFTSFRAFVFSIFFFTITSVIFPQKLLIKKRNHQTEASFIKLDFFQNNSALRNVKCDWSISFIQVERNRTHLIFLKLHHTNTCTLTLYEFVILHSQTSWIIQVVSYKSCNVRPALVSQ